MSGQLITIVRGAFEVMSWLIIARVLLSWIRHNPYSPIIRFVYEITEPILGPFRRLIPRLGAIDFSPIIALLALRYLETIIIKLLLNI
ncbi:MAG: YggT family protein [Bacillota bacterium]|nr:YggT family protein [Bacillota bacterium]